MAELRIKTLYDSVWKIFGFQHGEALADRNRLRTKIERRLGPETASEIQRHIDVALGRLQADDVPNPEIMAMREFYELLALEKTIEEIERRIEANAVFYDPDNSHSLLPTLGLSWQDVLPLVYGQENPGYMPPENVKKFLGMVQNAEQQFPSDEEIEGTADEIADHFRQRLRELTEFLERAVKLREALYCDL